MAVVLNDELCLKLAQYLSEFINNKFVTCYGDTYPDIKVINGIEQYNKIQVQLDHFPLLKVYRVQDLYPRGARSYSTAEIEISYSCAFPDIDNLPGLLTFVSKALIEGISSYAFSNQNLMPVREDKVPIQVNYGIAANEFINQTYPYLTTRISVNDLCEYGC